MAFYYLLMVALTAPEWGWPGWVAACAVPCLIVGIVLALRRPSRRLCWLALPFGVTEIFVLLAWLARPGLSHTQAGMALVVFALAIAGIVTLLIGRMKGHRATAVLVGMGAAGHALIGAVMAYLSLTGDWL